MRLGQSVQTLLSVGDVLGGRDHILGGCDVPRVFFAVDLFDSRGEAFLLCVPYALAALRYPT